ncbi:MAG: TonB-dependent receptor [Blastocatellia bacterium]
MMNKAVAFISGQAKLSDVRARVSGLRSLLTGLAACCLLWSGAMFCGAQTPAADKSDNSAAAKRQGQQPATTPDDLTNKSLEELMNIEVESVYSASKFMQKITEAPASVTIVTREEIHRYGYRTLADILRSVRGFYVTYDRSYYYVGVRGFARPGDYNSRVLVMVDGHRVNENIYDGGYVGTEFQVDVDLIERVEIVRGPGSSLYGTNAVFAVINVVTRRGGEVKGAEFSAQTGSFNADLGRVTIGHKWRSGAEMLLSGTMYSSHGQRRLYFAEFDDPATNYGLVENADADRSRSLLGTFSYRNFTLQTSLLTRRKQVPTATYGNGFNDPRYFISDTHGYADLSYNRTFAGDTGVSGRLYFDRYIYDSVNPYETGAPGQSAVVLTRDQAFGSWWGGELQLHKRIFHRHLMTTGAEYRHNLRQQQVNYDAEPYHRNADTQPRTSNTGIYGQDEVTLRSSLKFVAGLRFDHYSTFGQTWSPRAGLIWNPLTHTTVKLLYGQAFRAPNVYELFYDFPGVYIGNAGLQPERIRTSELIVEQYVGTRYRFSGSLFQNSMRNLINISYNADKGLISFANLDAVRAKGAEFEAEGRLASGFQGRVSYTFQQATDVMTGAWLSNSPRHLGKLNLTGPLLTRKLFAGLDLQYQSHTRTRTGQAADDASAYWLPNLTLSSLNLFRGFDASFSIYNLTDQQYAHPVGDEGRQNVIEQDGRSFRVKLTYRFPAGRR